MSSALLPTSFLPNFYYFSILAQFEEIIIEQHETFPKQTYRNRCTILSANGPLNLIVPVNKPNGNSTKSCDIIVDISENWPKRYWRAIESAYNASPFFQFYADDIYNSFIPEYKQKLMHYNDKLIQTICNLCNLTYNPKLTRAYIKDSEYNDYRLNFHPNKKKNTELPVYNQVFSNKYSFQNNLSIIDLLFNLGPEISEYLYRIQIN